ncbi:BREX-1 system adenine-specific DNA-methyltransferase PglX [Latilactobacillus sakei]|uniref:BREX-1 system adenine-specific DNA-methyltransferase PglX n=1 Tax=Latilactobacillus sakei TaxID=1599 RepID=UPI0024082722|nr:BREX-1 system adenine-specific DNA-methyltransferase PglX [Latilactobacillus sakei]WEY49718.1 BREX-1 system adenine-specific DNA-methyltransferase PglX [Latilactobacillus sakei]
MDKKLIKTFAIEARVKLRESVMSKLANLGITDEKPSEITEIGNDTIKINDNNERLTGNDVKNRAKLIEELNKRGYQTEKHKIAYDTLVEEVAYTWFNRLIAIRFMEVNDYLPERERVLSSESGIKQPDIITHLLDTEMYAEFDLATKERVTELLSDSSADAVDELYQLVFIKQCNNLNQQLPDLFEKIDDYTELLFTISYIDDNGVIALLLNIPEDAFNVDEGGQVEIIGWMYQYYNTEPKDKVFARGSRKIRADEIPAATQLFTPDWIVRYMVENSLGRYYIDQKMANPNEIRTEKEIADEFNWQYYLPTAEQPEDVQLQIQDERQAKSDFALQELKLIDPSMGSGHILVYAFDVFMQLYEAEGQSPRTAAELILENNLFGLDIDQRAFQLAYFALMMKGRQYSRRILSKQLRPNIYAVPNNSEIGEAELQLVQMQFNNQKKAQQDLLTLVEGFKNGAELGSLIKFEGLDFENLKSGLNNTNISFFEQSIKEMILVGELLQQQYEIGITNPPYMGSSGMDKILSGYVKKIYPDSKSDLFGVFIERLEEMIKSTGYYAMITQHAWMFLSSFEKLRIKINQQTIINMAHLGTRAFEEIGGEVVQTTSFVLTPKKYKHYNASYLRLVNFENHKLKEIKALEAITDGLEDYLFKTAQDNFQKIPGQPISYWVSEKIGDIFDSFPVLSDIAEPKSGLATGNNNIFQKRWYEVNFNKIGFNYNSTAETSGMLHKWYPENSGSFFRKWYPANEYVVNWELNGKAIKSYRNSSNILAARPQNTNFYFKKGITWNKLSSSRFGVRYKEEGFIFDDTSRSLFPNNSDDLYYLTGFLCSSFVFNILKILNPTMSFTNNDISRIPIDIQSFEDSRVIDLVKENISVVKQYDGNFEEYWNYTRNPLI